MNYHTIKKARQDATNELFTTLGVFWAFSNKQFDENKTPLKEGEKYISIGAGGYMPKGNFDALIAGNKKIDADFKQSIKDAKARTEHILYELNNHEAFYTGTIEDTMGALGEDYTEEEVLTVYKEYKKAKYKQNLSTEQITEKYV